MSCRVFCNLYICPVDDTIKQTNKQVFCKPLLKGPSGAAPVLFHTTCFPAGQQVLAEGVPAGDWLEDGDFQSTVCNDDTCNCRLPVGSRPTDATEAA